MIRFLCTLIFVFNSLCAITQIRITGTIIDQHNNPVAYASITTPHKISTISDINGRYSIYLHKADSVYVSFLGFKSHCFYATHSLTKNIQLRPRPYSIEEISVFPKINPANSIMQHVIKNKNSHNPLRLSSYKHMAYNKFTIKVNQDTVEKLIDQGFNSPTLIRINQLADQSHLFISEVISEISYKKPNPPKEIILTTNISGFNDPAFALLGNQIQSLSCYNDFFNIAHTRYINPISNNSWKHYLFLIKDTLYEQNGDTTFVITFCPEPEAKFSAMRGIIYINAQDFAIRKIVAQPAFQTAKFNFEIEQEYLKINGHFWFPKKLLTKLSFFSKIDPDNPPIPILIGVAETKIINPQIDIEIQKNILRKQFPIHFSQNSDKPDKKLLTKYRTDSLTYWDLNTFKFMDTMTQKPTFRFLNSLPKILSSAIVPIKFIDLYINEVLGHNYQEKFRIGISAMTNKRLSKYFSIGGKFVYSTKLDTLWYAAKIVFSPLKSGIIKLKYQYQRESAEKGFFDFYNPYKPILNNYRRFILPTVNYTQSQNASLEIEYPRYTNIRIVGIKETLTLSHTSIDTCFGNFSRTSTRIDIRFAPGEKLINMGSYRLKSDSKYPIFNLVIEKGFASQKRDVKYSKYMAAFTYNAKTRFYGTWRLLAQTGIIEGNIPLHLTFNSRGAAKIPLFEPGVFFTMPVYKFFNTEFVQCFIQHSFPIHNYNKNLVFSISPQLNFMYGNIKKERLCSVATPASKGFYEAGIFGGIKSPDIGKFVIGAFYTLGAYKCTKTINNFAIVLGFMSNIDW